MDNKFAASFLTGLIGSSLGFNLLTIYYDVGNPTRLSNFQCWLIIFICIAPFAYIFYKKGDTYLENNKEHCYSNKRIFNFFLVVVLTSSPFRLQVTIWLMLRWTLAYYVSQ